MALKTLSYLDRVRLVNGSDMCRSYFRELCEREPKRAVSLINDKKLLFVSLFMLMPEIEERGIYEHLNTRNTIAIKICRKILKIDSFLIESREEVYGVLKWMLISGANDDGLSSEYDRIIDGVSSLLINTYTDKALLKVVADVIFRRNRRGAFIHDLVWAFFGANDPNALRIIAEFLRSNVKEDIDLAYKLLNLEPNSENGYRDRHKQYLSYLSWVKENYPYIIFTGESFNLTSNPKPVSVDLGGRL